MILGERFSFSDRFGLSTLLFCWAVLFFPTYHDLWQGLWRSNDQSQGPIVLALSIWLMGRKMSQPDFPAPALRSSGWGWCLFGAGLLLYVLGRSQEILLFEVGAQVPIVAALLVLLYGEAVLKQVWFPLLFMLFMVPLPGGVVDALTMPMKLAVSWAVECALYGLGYPIARNGVVLQMGQYKLLVADACAGLHTLFTLESLGLLYLHLVRRESWFRNVILAVLIVPIAFAANSIRVASLVLITYYYGDAVGQGFLHGFAGMTLFVSAFLIILSVDGMLTFAARLLPARNGYAHV